MIQVDAPQASDRPSGSSEPRDRHGYFRWLVFWVCLAALFTDVMIQRSMRHGRLLVWPAYDDSSYIRDGLDRIYIYKHGGMSALVRDIRWDPPHSPVFTLLSVTGLLAFGMHFWAPYATTGLIVLGLLLATDRLMLGTRPWQRIAAALFVLSVPISGLCVTEFRPDCATGLVTAMAIILFLYDPLDTPLRSQTFWRPLGIGMLWCAALLCKPTVVPLTMLLAGLCAVWYVVLGKLVEGRTIRKSLSWRFWLPMFAPFILLGVPYFILAYSELRLYVYEAMFGTFRNTWRLAGGWEEQFRFFLVGASGKLMFGSYFAHLAILLVLVVIGMLIVIVRLNARQFLRWIALLTVMAVAYLFPTVNPTKNEFFAVVFQMMLVFTGVIVLRQLFAVNSRWIGIASGTVATLMIVSGLAASQFPESTVILRASASDPLIQAIRRVNQGIYDTYKLTPATPVRTMYSTLPGLADGISVSVKYFMEDVELPVNVERYATSLVRYRHFMGLAEYVAACQKDNGVDISYVPSGPFADDALLLADSSPDLQFIGEIPSMNDKNYFLYIRGPAFEGFDSARGLGEFQDGDEMIDFPTIRLGLAPASRLSFQSAHDQNFQLSFSALPRLPRQDIQIILNGQAIGSCELTRSATGTFTSELFTLPCREGRNQIELNYSDKEAAVSGGRPAEVAFSCLRILPGDPAPNVPPPALRMP